MTWCWSLLVLVLKDCWGTRPCNHVCQLDLRPGQLWADGQLTLQLHQQRQVARASAHVKGSLMIPPDSKIVAPVSIQSPAGIPLNLVLVSAVSVTQTVVVDTEANQPLPEHLEDIVTGSHPSLGDEGQATLRNILHKFMFSRLRVNRSPGVLGRSDMILQPTVPGLFSVGHVAWHRRISGLNRNVSRRCWKGDRLSPMIVPGRRQWCWYTETGRFHATRVLTTVG